MLTIILLGLTSLLTDFSSEMVAPILPLFIQALGGTGIAVGLILGVGDAVAAILKVFSGRIADRTRRYHVLVFLGYAFSVLAKFGYLVSTRLAAVAFIRPVERMGKGLRDAPRDAIVSESLGKDDRGRGFGIQRAMDSIGAVLGSAAVLLFFVRYGIAFSTLFLVSALIGIAGLVPIFFIRMPARLSAGETKKISFGALSPALKRFIAVATLFALAAFSYGFLVLRTQMSFAGLGSYRALELALVIYIFFNLCDAVVSEPAGMLSDRIGRKKVILLGYAAFMLVSGGFLLMSWFSPGPRGTFVVLMILFMLYGAYKALIDASQRAFVSDLSSPELRATALGTFETCTGLAAIPSGLIAGLLWNITPAATFLFGLVMSSLAAFLLLTKVE